MKVLREGRHYRLSQDGLAARIDGKTDLLAGAAEVRKMAGLRFVALGERVVRLVDAEGSGVEVDPAHYEVAQERLSEGWHELRIDCVKQVVRRRHLFVSFEMSVLRSTSPEHFSGQEVHHVINMSGIAAVLAEERLDCLAIAAADPAVHSVVAAAKHRVKYLLQGHDRLFDSDSEASCSAIVLCAGSLRKMRGGLSFLSFDWARP